MDIEQRPPAAVESAAYFVVSEALANVARHARATQAHVAIVQQGDRLIVEVRDNGVGGADPAAGTGLSGLAERVTGMCGTTVLLSPPGGPTTLSVELPRVLIAEDSALLRGRPRADAGARAAAGRRATRVHVRAMVRRESVIVATLGTLCRAAVGVLAGWGLIQALTESEGGGTFALPGGPLVAIVLVGAAVGVVAGLRPAWRA